MAPRKRKIATSAEEEKYLREAEYISAQTEHERILTDLARLDYERASKERMRNDNNRVLDFTREVSRSYVEETIQTLHSWRRTSSDPIVIRLSSPGGSVIDGLALYDTIKSLSAEGIKITTVALGWAASMAAVLLQAGNERVVGNNAYILIHEVSSAAIGKLSEIEDEAKFTKKLNDRLFDILAERATVKRSTIAKHAKRRDWWLSAEECLRFGFADRIGYI